MLHITNRHSLTLTSVLTLLWVLFIQCHSGYFNCEDLRNGRFYFFVEKSGAQYLLIRQDSLQKEVNLATNDTSYWKLAWIDDCTYTLNYLSGGGMKSEDEQEFLRSHTNIFKIQKKTAEYYIIKASLDSLNSIYSMTDTLWMQAK